MRSLVDTIAANECGDFNKAFKCSYRAEELIVLKEFVRAWSLAGHTQAPDPAWRALRLIEERILHEYASLNLERLLRLLHLLVSNQLQLQLENIPALFHTDHHSPPRTRSCRGHLSKQQIQDIADFHLSMWASLRAKISAYTSEQDSPVTESCGAACLRPRSLFDAPWNDIFNPSSTSYLCLSAFKSLQKEFHAWAVRQDFQIPDHPDPVVLIPNEVGWHPFYHSCRGAMPTVCVLKPAERGAEQDLDSLQPDIKTAPGDLSRPCTGGSGRFFASDSDVIGHENGGHWYCS